MKTLLFTSLSVLLMCSCTVSEYLASATPQGNTVRERRGQLGGTWSSSRSDGSSEAGNNENSFKDGAAIAAATIAGWSPAGKIRAGATLKGTKDPNVIPKDPNVIPKDPNVIPKDPNVIPLDPNLVKPGP